MRFIGLICLLWTCAYAQVCTVKGKIVDDHNQPIAGVRILLESPPTEFFADSLGRYTLSVPKSDAKIIKLYFEHSSFDATIIQLDWKPGYVYDKPIKMGELTLDNTEIIGSKNRQPQMQIIPIKTEELSKLPMANPSVEAILQTMGGVVSNNEFSTQYRVRGGSFDENLIYVNGIEVYRPQLARSGQMEGLGFANRDMTQQIAFSTGGFSAQYGDKMSSVLDITYRQPKQFKGSVELGLVSNSLHLEGISKNRKDSTQLGKFTWMVGARQFSLKYLLNSLSTKGNYQPSFMDVQGMFTWTPIRSFKANKYVEKNGKMDSILYPIDRLKFTLLCTGARNRYLFFPQSSSETLGTIQQSFQLSGLFVGQEISSYTTFTNAFLAEYKPTSRLSLQAIVSDYIAEEAEKFDVEGGYVLAELNTNLGSDEFGETGEVLGTGSLYRYARNYLTMHVTAAEIKGSWANNNDFTHKFSWGARGELHNILDEVNEYNLYDSAQYVVNQVKEFGVTEYIKQTSKFDRRMFRAFAQDEWTLGQASTLTMGVRYTFDDLIQRQMISPRVQYVYDLSKRDADKKLQLRLAAGVYHQPPYFREFRRRDGSFNLDLKPQTAIHYIAGLNYVFKAWGRDFTVFSEAYYKDLRNIVPYEVTNVRLRYWPDYQVRGYAAGWDTRLSGEFVKGLDSWMSLSFLRTKEDSIGNSGVYFHRPTDQFLTFSWFFQDELPVNPTFKAHINFIMGTGLRTNYPGAFEQRNNITYPFYNRVDMGLSKMVMYKSSDDLAVRKHAISSLWATLEVFNIFNRGNVVSYEWVKTFQNQFIGVPNRLSNRLISIRMVMNFK